MEDEQMKNKRMVLILMFVLLVHLSMSTYEVIASEVNETVRVGLLYNDPNISSISSVDSVNINSDSGLDMISYENGSEKIIGTFDIQEKVSVRKEVYFVRNGEETTKISTEQIANYQNGVEGTFHIKVGGSYSTYMQAKEILNEYKNKGANVFIAYTGDFEIWSGNFYNMETRNLVLNELTSTIGSKNYSFIGNSDKRIICYTLSGEVIFAFDYDNGAFRIRSKDIGKNDRFLEIEGLKFKIYRGAFEFIRLDSSDLTVVNVVNMREYLYGVVPFEIGGSSPKEAVKAQAVAARTYALKNSHKHKDLTLDICNTVHCQYYGGVYRETENTNTAVNETDSKVITYEGNLASVFYFASSGGYTANVENVWGTPIPYLVSVKDEYEDETSSRYHWDKVLSAQQIKDILTKKGYNIGKVLSVNITKRSEVGRVTEVTVKGTTGEKVIERNRTRTTFGLNSQWYDIYTEMDVNILTKKDELVKESIAGRKYITSSGVKDLSNLGEVTILKKDNELATLNMTAENYRFIGRGWGHSVGMSQVGAIGMAKNGFTYEEILKHYYTGVDISDMN
jgi:stage II sporulation protein D